MSAPAHPVACRRPVSSARAAALAAALLAASLPCLGQGAAPPAAAVREKFTACVPCHGADGRATTLSSYPKIGGQNADYVVNALKAYRAGRRQGGYAAIMAEVARKLSDEDIAALATYIQALDAPALPAAR